MFLMPICMSHQFVFIVDFKMNWM